MKEINANMVLTENHRKLLRISKFANVAFWIAIGIVPLSFVSYYLQLFGQSGIDKQVFLSLINEPDFLIQMLLNFFTLLVKSLVWILVLKSVSLGLRMIVNTDINYRSKGEKSNG